MQRLALSVGAGAAIGASAAYAYKAVRAPPRPPGFMDDAATTELLPGRQRAEKQLNGLLYSASARVEECRQRSECECKLLDFACRKQRAAAATEHKELLATLRRAAAAISFGPNADGTDMADERDEYVRKYGCVAWTDEALDILGACAVPSGIIEVGAGAGQWASALRSKGVNILATDDGSSSPLPGKEARIVTMGIDGAAAAAQHPQRTLLMVAPPPGPQALGWLRAYKGARVVYVGEGRGGAHADGAFFDAVEAEWQLEAHEELRPFKGGAEQLYVLQRRWRKE